MTGGNDERVVSGRTLPYEARYGGSFFYTLNFLTNHREPSRAGYILEVFDS